MLLMLSFLGGSLVALGPSVLLPVVGWLEALVSAVAGASSNSRKRRTSSKFPWPEWLCNFANLIPCSSTAFSNYFETAFFELFGWFRSLVHTKSKKQKAEGHGHQFPTSFRLRNWIDFGRTCRIPRIPFAKSMYNSSCSVLCSWVRLPKVSRSNFVSSINSPCARHIVCRLGTLLCGKPWRKLCMDGVAIQTLSQKPA